MLLFQPPSLRYFMTAAQADGNRSQWNPRLSPTSPTHHKIPPGGTSESGSFPTFPCHLGVSSTQQGLHESWGPVSVGLGADLPEGRGGTDGRLCRHVGYTAPCVTCVWESPLWLGSPVSLAVFAAGSSRPSSHEGPEGWERSAKLLGLDLGVLTPTV